MHRQRWLARLAILLVAAAIGVPVGFAGLHSIGLLVTGALGAGVMLAGAYWFVARRGLVRWAAFVLAVCAPAALIALYATRGLLVVALGSVALAVLGFAAAGAALTGPGIKGQPGIAGQEAAQEPAAARPRHAFVIMNPRSGGGKVAKFRLKEKAESLGAEVAMLSGPQVTDVAALARKAVADGADLLGVAGGDGTQALVAGIAAEHDLPFLCVSAGTRNHFALDLGLDRDDPAACLDALADGIERRIDLGRIGERTFVNNASFGVYAEIVRTPAYRDDKAGTTLAMLPDLLACDDAEHRLLARAGQRSIEGSQAVLVSNNPYELNDIAGLGRRPRLDSGTLGVVAIKVDGAAQAIGLLQPGHGPGLTVLSAPEITVAAAQPEIPVGIDGETVLMPTPVRCSVQPGALRVVLPRNRPGARPARQPFSLARLARLAAGAGVPRTSH